MMNDYSRTQELVAAAYDSEGSSQAQFEKTLDSLDAKLTQLKNAWDSFTMGLANNEVIKLVVDTLTLILNIFNKVTDAFGSGTSSVMKLVAAFALFGGLSKTLPKLINKIAKSVVQGLSESGNEAGKDTVDNIAKKIKEGKADVYKAARDLGESAKQGYEDGASGATSELGQRLLINATKPTNQNPQTQTDESQTQVQSQQQEQQIVPATTKAQKGLAITAGVAATASAVINLLRTSVEEASGELDHGAEAGFQLAEGLATTVTAAASTASTMLSLGGSIANLAGPVGIAIAAIGVLITIFKAADEWIVTDEERVEDFRNELEETQNAYDELVSAHDGYTDAINSLADLVEGTEEYTAALNQASQQAKILNDLSNGAVGIYWNSEKGYWEINQEEYKAWQAEQAKELKQDKLKTLAAEVKVSSNKEKTDYDYMMLQWSDRVAEASRESLMVALREGGNSAQADLIQDYYNAYDAYIDSIYKPNNSSANQEKVKEILVKHNVINESDEVPINALSILVNFINDELEKMPVGTVTSEDRQFFAEEKRTEGYAADYGSLTEEELNQQATRDKVTEETLLTFFTQDQIDALEAGGLEINQMINLANRAIAEREQQWQALYGTEGKLSDTNVYDDLTTGQRMLVKQQQDTISNLDEESKQLYENLWETLKNTKGLTEEQREAVKNLILTTDFSDKTSLEQFHPALDDLGIESEDLENAFALLQGAVVDAGIAIRKTFDIEGLKEAVISNRKEVQNNIDNQERTFTEDVYNNLKTVFNVIGEEKWLADNFEQNHEGEWQFTGSFVELQKKLFSSEGGAVERAIEVAQNKANVETTVAAAAMLTETTDENAKQLLIDKAQARYDAAQAKYSDDNSTADEKEAAEQDMLDASIGIVRLKSAEKVPISFYNEYASLDDFSAAAALDAGDEGYISDDTLQSWVSYLFKGVNDAVFEDLFKMSKEEWASAEMGSDERGYAINAISNYAYGSNGQTQLADLQNGGFGSLEQNAQGLLLNGELTADELSSKMLAMAQNTEGAEAILNSWNKTLEHSDDIEKALAIDTAQATKRFQSFGDTLSDNLNTLKDSTKGTAQYNDAMTDVVKAARLAFGESVDQDWIEKNLVDLEAALNGDEDAFKRVQKSAAELNKGLVSNIKGIEQVAESVIDNEWSMTPIMDLSNITKGMEATKENAEALAAYLESYGFVVDWQITDNGQGLPAITGKVARAGNGFIGRASSGGGGGGGGGSNKNWENPYDPLYNLTEKINEALREREKLEREYDRLLEDRNGNFLDIIKNTLDTMANLEEEIALQQRLQEGRRAQLENIGSETFYDSDGNKKTFSEAGVMQYASYDFGTQTITIDWSAIDAITDTDKGEAVEAYISRLEELQEQFEDTQETLEEMQDELEEIKERGKEEYLDFEQKVYDAIVERQQQIIDDFQDLSDDINDANSKILDDLQKSIELQRQIRDNTETEEDIADKEARLAYLQRDTSGANASEILRLQQEIEDARQDYQDTLIDQELDRLNDVNETANEQRERQIEIMQSQLDWDEKNGAFWEETYGLIQGALNEDGSFNRNSDLVKLLADTDAFKGMSDFGKLNWIGELIQQFNEAQQGYSNWMVDRVSKEGTEINAVDAQGNSVELTYKDGKWTQGDDTYSVEYDATSKSYVAKKNEKAKTIEEYTQGTGAATTTKKSTSGGSSSSKEETKIYQSDKYPLYRYDSKTGEIKKYGTITKMSTVSAEDANNIASQESNASLQKALKDKGINAVVTGSSKTAQAALGLNGVYATGGLNTETGPAWLDGTPSKPEYVLNATQTEAFLKLTKVLPDLLGGNSTTTTRGGDTYYDVKFIVDEMSSDYDVDQLWERFKQKIYEDGSYRNTTVINRLR